MTIINLGNKTIKKYGQPYIIAEVGVNHEGSLERAKKLISLAKDGGADAFLEENIDLFSKSRSIK